MNKKQKLKHFISHLVCSGICTSQKDLGKKLGYKNQYSFSQIVNSDYRIEMLVPKLKKLYPDLNEDYILGDSDEMLISNERQPEQAEEEKIEVSQENKKENTLYKRASELLHYLNFDKFRKLSQEIGFGNPQMFTDIKLGKAKTFSKDFLLKLKDHYPEINTEYLQLGKGTLTDKFAAAERASDFECVNQAEQYNVTRIVEPKPVVYGRVISEDLQQQGTRRLREYLSEQNYISANSLLPYHELYYQVKSDCLRPFLLENDWITLLFTPKDKLVNGRVYLVDLPKSNLVKRLEIQEDFYVLSVPFDKKYRDYPTIKVSKHDDVDFYDLVSRITNNVSDIFNEESADSHYMALAAVDANRQLLINESKAHDNVKAAESNTERALKIIEELTKGNNNNL